MTGQWLGLVVMIGVLLGAGPVRVAETVTWLQWHMAPGHILFGAQRGRGGFQRVQDYLVQRIPEFAHRTMEISRAARDQVIRNLDEFCLVPAFYTLARARSYVLSLPIFVLPYGAVIAADRSEIAPLLPYLDSAGKVDLPNLLADPSLRTSITRGRLYGREIDRALRQIGRRPHLHTAPHGHTPALQLFAGWIDYAITYEVEIGFAAQQLGEPVERLRFFPVANVPDLALLHVMCSKSPLGRRVIDRTDEIILAAGPKPPWLGFLDEWTPETTRRRLDAFLAQQNPWADPTELRALMLARRPVPVTPATK